ncbi:MAG: hypothetical protein WCO18_02355 [bacterium]
MSEEQLNLNFERPSAEALTDEVFEKIIEESKSKRIELEDVNRIIKSVFGKNHLDPNTETNLLMTVIGSVIPEYRKKIKETISPKKISEGPKHKDWMRDFEERTGQWDTD